MGLEIEFDYEDTQGGVWSAADEAPPLRERVGRRWNRGLAAGNPLFVHLGIALTALALGAASTAGFVEGSDAARDRATILLHLAPVDPFVVEPLRVPQADSAEQLPSTPWTNAFDQHVALNVINDGPDPVTVLDAKVTAPEFSAAADLKPVAPSHDADQDAASTPTLASKAAGHNAAAPALTAPGRVTTLRGTAHIVCGDFTSIDLAATVARLTVRTADGRTRTQTLTVDQLSDTPERAVCRVMPGPQAVTSVASVPSRNRGAYTFTVGVTNRAPYPLLATMPSVVVDEWQSIAGLTVQVPPPTTIAPHASAVIRIPVAVSSCDLALHALQSAYPLGVLRFTDARDAPDDPLARVNDQNLALYNAFVITQYCGAPGSPPTGGGGSGN